MVGNGLVQMISLRVPPSSGYCYLYMDVSVCRDRICAGLSIGFGYVIVKNIQRWTFGALIVPTARCDWTL